MTDAQRLEILWEDAHILVVNKPAGLLTQPRGPEVGEPSLEDVVRSYLDPSEPSAVYLGTVHRLDRPVSGVVLWAKNKKAARRLSMQFERRSVEKTYVAAVQGSFGPGELPATWVDHLGPVGPSGTAIILDEPTPETRRGETDVSALGSVIDPASTSETSLSLLRLHPRTGRTHQLRAQCAKRGHPIVGDAAYGSAKPFARGITLHARVLVVHHPSLDRRVTFEAPWPRDWIEAGLVSEG